MSHSIAPREITVVVPVRNDERRVLRLVSGLLAHDEGHAGIVVVDNRSDPPLDRPGGLLRALPVVLERCDRPGPAAARNVGWRRATSRWILFTDSDCVPCHGFVSGYSRAQTEAVGFAGAVESLGEDTLSTYYEQQKILMPPPDAERCPHYLVTANCLVLRDALDAVGGFDETFPIAGGEDVDLGIRLRAVGRVEFNLASRVRHDFEPTVGSFLRRFLRYGYGNALVARKRGLDLRPQIFDPSQPGAVARGLSVIQFLTMMYGYELGLRGVAIGR